MKEKGVRGVLEPADLRLFYDLNATVGRWDVCNGCMQTRMSRVTVLSINGVSVKGEKKATP